MVQVLKNQPANAGVVGSILGLERSPGGGNGNSPVFLPGKIPWTEEPAPWGCKESDRI